MQLHTTREVENFGRNIRFVPQSFFEPADEAELLSVMQQYSGSKFRAIGSLHAWSPVGVCEEVVVSTKHFNHVIPCESCNSTTSAWVGSGIQIKSLIVKLDELGLSLPSLGLISEQTLAGAISTSTHGSGRHSLSHYVQAVRLARYDENGQPAIETIDSGDSLRAIQCGLGNLGIIVEIKIACRHRYNIAEVWRRYDNLEQVIDCENEHPLQQFFLLPWKWSYLVQHRRESEAPTSKLHWLYRIYFFLAIDLALHVILLTAGKILNSTYLVQGLFRRLLWRSIIPNWLVVGPSHEMLIMEHEMFRHIETELFVTRERLAESLDFVRCTLVCAAGEIKELPREFEMQLDEIGMLKEFRDLVGNYCHHYPICVRRILPDSSMLSMSSGGSQDWYSISLISYHRVQSRQGFFETMSFMARAMAKRFEARPHWGKHNPLGSAELSWLYPELDRFVAVRRTLDPLNRFQSPAVQDYLDSTNKSS